MRKTVLKLGLAACAFAAANANAFYGTRVENYKPNPWLDRPMAESRQDSSAAGATRPSSEVNKATREQTTTREDLIERLWRESARTSSLYGA